MKTENKAESFDNGEEKNTGEKRVSDSELRMFHYFLSMHRGMLENMRLGYLKRFEDSGREFTNELAKANHVQVEINTIDAWLEKHPEHKVDDMQVTHLNPDYTFKKVLEF